jgi:hypothetical protein
MTWFYFNGNSGNIWFSASEDGNKYNRTFSVDSSGRLTVKYYNRTLNSTKTLALNTFSHVAMVLNKQEGLSIFINGEVVANERIVDNTKMDFPNAPLNPRICDTKGMYDDFRIYNGIVTAKHVKSIFKCGRVASCTQLAHAKPQSRRTYCIVPKYRSGSHSNFVTPCVTGLFFTGAAIDLNLIIDQKGVLFSFRDTALHESSFEILRRGADKNWNPTGEYEAVVLIDSTLDLCATTFSSITFVDDEVMRVPGEHWEYAIRTKYPDNLNKSAVISDPVGGFCRRCD